jgi:hypothetical protein
MERGQACPACRGSVFCEQYAQAREALALRAGPPGNSRNGSLPSKRDQYAQMRARRGNGRNGAALPSFPRQYAREARGRPGRGQGAALPTYARQYARTR